MYTVNFICNAMIVTQVGKERDFMQQELQKRDIFHNQSIIIRNGGLLVWVKYRVSAAVTLAHVWSAQQVRTLLSQFLSLFLSLFHFVRETVVWAYMGGRVRYIGQLQ